jgi:hypothetical protein
MPGSRLGLPGPCAAQCNTKEGGMRGATRRLGRPEVRLPHSARVRWSGVHSHTRPHARRAACPPGSRGRARRYRRDEARCLMLSPASEHARVEARLAHNKRLAWRRRARGESCPEALARRGGHPCSSAGRRPSFERAVACAGHSRA